MKDISKRGTPFAVLCKTEKEMVVVIDFLNKIYPDYLISKPTFSSIYRNDNVCGFIGGTPTYDFAFSHPDLEKMSFGEFFHRKIEMEIEDKKYYSEEEVFDLVKYSFKRGYEISNNNFNNEIIEWDHRFDKLLNDLLEDEYGR